MIIFVRNCLAGLALFGSMSLLQAMAAAEGGRVTHVKPHGALNNIACADAEVAATVADAAANSNDQATADSAATAGSRRGARASSAARYAAPWA